MESQLLTKDLKVKAVYLKALYEVREVVEMKDFNKPMLLEWLEEKIDNLQKELARTICEYV
jgi:hypothetical protein